MAFTFKGGIQIPHFKAKTEHLPIKDFPFPSQVVIPLLQHTGRPAEPVVEPGQVVTRGTLIGKPGGVISAGVHASISGRVKEIKPFPHPLFPSAPAVVIERIEETNGGIEEFKEERNWETLSRKELLEIIREAGIVGLGGAAFPTAVKLTPPDGVKIDALIINGAECEPYLTADHRVMLEKTQEILIGIEIIKKILEVENAYLGIEVNKRDAIVKMEKYTRGSSLKIIPLKCRYPQGAEKQLIKTILDREVPSGGLPFQVGVVVHNVGTCLAIKEAVVNKKPLIERVITITGNGVKEPQNFRVPLGTLFSEILNSTGCLFEKLGKVIMGGPMMGIAQASLDVPVIKGTSGIVTFLKSELREELEGPCISCARCIEACPMNLVPALLGDYIEKRRFEESKQLGVMDCIECGSCTYTCPAKRRLVTRVKYAKQVLREEKK